MALNVLVTDDIDPEGVQLLVAQPELRVDEVPTLPKQELLSRIGQYDALVGRSATRISEELLREAKKLKVVGRAGVGVDNIALEAATALGIAVINAPAGNTVAVAELFFGVMIGLLRHLPRAAQSMREGKWDRSQFLGNELKGRTLGIVGVGRIGSEIAARAQVFCMEVVGFDPYIADDRFRALRIRRAPTLDALLEEAEVVTVHTPLNDETKGLIGRRELSILRPGAIVANLARGGIVDDQALLAALESGHLRARRRRRDRPPESHQCAHARRGAGPRTIRCRGAARSPLHRRGRAVGGDAGVGRGGQCGARRHAAPNANRQLSHRRHAAPDAHRAHQQRCPWRHRARRYAARRRRRQHRRIPSGASCARRRSPRRGLGRRHCRSGYSPYATRAARCDHGDGGEVRGTRAEGIGDREQPRVVISTDLGVRQAFARDASGLELLPDAVARPTTEEEVISVLRDARAAGKAVTPAGGQTSTTGASITDGAVLLSLRGLGGIGEVGRDRITIRVQSGVNLGDLKRRLAADGLLFAPDPTSEDDVTVGGAIACNASGARSLLCGPTRSHVAALRVALAD